MNLHPIFVHFPIALLSLYTFFEVVRFNFITRQPYYFYIKAILVTTGGLGALAAFFTGNQATGAIRQTMQYDPQLRALRHLHSSFANLTMVVYGLLAAAYLIAWMGRDHWFLFLEKDPFKGIWSWLVKIANEIVNNTWLMVMAAIVGFIVITATGGLGGIMVYGDKADPFFVYFYHLFVK